MAQVVSSAVRRGDTAAAPNPQSVCARRAVVKKGEVILGEAAIRTANLAWPFSRPAGHGSSLLREEAPFPSAVQLFSTVLANFTAQGQVKKWLTRVETRASLP